MQEDQPATETKLTAGKEEAAVEEASLSLGAQRSWPTLISALEEDLDVESEAELRGDLDDNGGVHSERDVPRAAIVSTAAAIEEALSPTPRTAVRSQCRPCGRDWGDRRCELFLLIAAGNLSGRAGILFSECGHCDACLAKVKHAMWIVKGLLLEGYRPLHGTELCLRWASAAVSLLRRCERAVGVLSYGWLMAGSRELCVAAWLCG